MGIKRTLHERNYSRNKVLSVTLSSRFAPFAQRLVASGASLVSLRKIVACLSDKKGVVYVCPSDKMTITLTGLHWKSVLYCLFICAGRPACSFVAPSGLHAGRPASLIYAC